MARTVKGLIMTDGGLENGSPENLGPMSDAVTSATTSSAGASRWGTALRAAVYGPLVLAGGLLSAAAINPELAERVSPLIDFRCPCSSTHAACQHAATAESPCCSHSQSCPSNTSAEESAVTEQPDLASVDTEDVPADALAALSASEANLGDN